MDVFQQGNPDVVIHDTDGVKGILEVRRPSSYKVLELLLTPFTTIFHSKRVNFFATATFMCISEKMHKSL